MCATAVFLRSGLHVGGTYIEVIHTRVLLRVTPEG